MSLSPLNKALHLPVTPQARLEIIQQLWPEPSTACRTALPKELGWDSYLKFYNRECNVALVDQGQHLCARNHGDLLQIAQLLKNEPTKEEVKSNIRQRLMQHRPSEDEETMLIGSVELAIHIVAMVSTGSLPNEISGQCSILWREGTLFEAMHAHFDDCLNLDTEPVILEPDLTARNIDRVAKISIIWTDNLVDHLRLVERDKKLCVFHHASFFKYMEHMQGPMYPKNFVRESLYILMLLFPSTDRKTKQWLQAELPTDLESTRIDLGLLHVGSFKHGHASRRLENYHFWHDRQGALKDAFDEATPPSKALLKALSDRKQGDRWLNSWVATIAIGLTLFFGLVQSVEGAVQVYKPYHPAAG